MTTLSDVFKWSILVVAVILIGTTFFSLFAGFNFTTVDSSFRTTINSLLTHIQIYINAFRGFLNLLAGSYIPIDIMLVCTMIYPFTKWGIKLTISLYHWIFK